VVACDQPFDEVEKPEFRQLLEYTHLRPSLHIPYRGAIRKRIMKMGEDTVEGVKKMIKVSVLQSTHSCHLHLSGTGLQSQLIARCLDFEQSTPFFGNCYALYYE
jgi:hypothetical protein